MLHLRTGILGEHHDIRLAHLCCIIRCSFSTQWLAVVGVITRLFTREACHCGGTSPDYVLMKWRHGVALGESALELIQVIVVCVLLLARWCDQERWLHCWGGTFDASHHHVSDLDLISMRIWRNHGLENWLLLLELKLLLSYWRFFIVICLASFLCSRWIFRWSIRWLFRAENWRSILILDLGNRLATNHPSCRRSDLNLFIVFVPCLSRWVRFQRLVLWGC